MAGRPTLQELEKLTTLPAPEDEVGTPGNVSQVSSVSAHSRCLLIKGNPQQDIYIEQGLESVRSGEDFRFGIGRWRPACLQRCCNIKAFVVCMSVLLAVSGTLSTGYLNSVLTTIEKRFEIGSSISGLIAASYEFGSLVAVVFISYLGGRRHIPVWIATGLFFMGLGAFLFTLPHFIAEKYTVYRGISVNDTEENICKINSDSLGNGCIDNDSGNWMYVLILISAQIMIGTGSTPILTLGTTYVDNHVHKDKAPAYLAFIYASGVLGPVLGYGLGALLLQYYVDMFSFEVKIRPGDPEWIGAWWGGFILCGTFLIVLVFPFLSFPRTLVAEKAKLLEYKYNEDVTKMEKREDQQSRHSNEYGKTIKDIPRSMLSLLKNDVYLVTCLGICCEIAIVSGFVVFLPKYLETQFGTTTSMANLFTGAIGIPGAVIGILTGGFLLKRFQLKPKGAIKLTLLLDSLALLGFLSFLVLGCDNPKIAGATFPYHASVNLNSSELEEFEIEANLTSTCNIGCSCSNNHLEPICGINGITYFSPCHAGCTQFFSHITTEEKMVNFSGCSCIMENSSISPEVIMSPVATSGPCKSTCQNLLPFLILLVILTFTVAGTQMPLLMITLRSVHEEERCFALGLQFVILRLFAYIPSPIMFGNTIDTACLLWRDWCGSSGSCSIYDIVQFRYRYVGISAGLKFMGTIFFLIVWILMRRQDRRDLQLNLPVGDMMASVNSINKLDLDYPQRHSLPRGSGGPQNLTQGMEEDQQAPKESSL